MNYLLILGAVLLYAFAGISSHQVPENVYPKMLRCHRAFLVNLSQVEHIASHAGSTQLLIRHCHESVPVSRSNMAQVKAAIQQVNH